MMKNFLNFLGLWSYPLGLIVSGMIIYFFQTMKMQSFNLDEKNVCMIFLGGLIAPFFVMLMNTYDFCAKGKYEGWS